MASQDGCNSFPSTTGDFFNAYHPAVWTLFTALYPLCLVFPWNDHCVALKWHAPQCISQFYWMFSFEETLYKFMCNIPSQIKGEIILNWFQVHHVLSLSSTLWITALYKLLDFPGTLFPSKFPYSTQMNQRPEGQHALSFQAGEKPRRMSLSTEHAQESRLMEFTSKTTDCYLATCHSTCNNSLPWLMQITNGLMSHSCWNFILILMMAF